MTRLHSINERLRHQRGAVAIWFALLLPVLLGLAALAVDLARIHLVKVELQNAADAAAMGGARSLTDAGALSGDAFNWTAAADSARAFAKRNVANGVKIQDANIETGYWNLQNPSSGLHGTLGTGDVPAVRATIAIAEGQNSGPLNLLFAPILGIGESNVQASAIAVIAPPKGGIGIFPFVISKAIMDANWHSDNQQSFTIKNNYPKGKGDGNWTSLNNPDNSKNYISGIMKTGNATPLSINSSEVWVATGTMDKLFQQVDSSDYIGKVFAIPVVTDLSPNSFQIYTIAAFQIISVDSKGNPKSITGKFVDAAIIPGLDPGDGTGTSYGAYTPPILVK